MFRKFGCFTVMAGLVMTVSAYSAPAQADGIGVMRFLVNNRYAPKKKAQPSWLNRRIVKPFREYRHAKRDVKRLRNQSQRMDRAFEGAFRKTFNARFNPHSSTIFGFFSAMGKGNRAGRLAVIDKAKGQSKRWGLSQLSIDYYNRRSAPKK